MEIQLLVKIREETLVVLFVRSFVCLFDYTLQFSLLNKYQFEIGKVKGFVIIYGRFFY